MSQMLMAEGEDIYGLMGKFNPTVYAKLGSATKGDQAQCVNTRVPVFGFLVMLNRGVLVRYC